MNNMIEQIDNIAPTNGADANNESPVSTPEVDLSSRRFVESLEPKVKKVDSDKDLDLFCYTTCTPEDPDYVKTCRGLVFIKDELILKAYSYSPDYCANDWQTLVDTYGNDLSSFRCFDSYEGALIRVFYAQDKWYISTHRRLNAFKSKWSSRISFGEMFAKSLAYENSLGGEFTTFVDENAEAEPSADTSPDRLTNRFISALDKSKQYMFLVQNNADNRIVCEAPENSRVFHVGTFQDCTLDLNCRVGLPYPKEHAFDTVDDLLTYVEESVDIKTMQGVIMFTPTEQVKILNRDYRQYFAARGNEPSIKFRYLQVRMDAAMKSTLAQLYPSQVEHFDMYENTLYEIALHIKNAYIKRFIKKEFVAMPSEEYSIMKECHMWHIEDRTHNHISFQKVINTLNQQSATKLNKMIRRYINDQRIKSLKDQEENALRERNAGVVESQPQQEVDEGNVVADSSAEGYSHIHPSRVAAVQSANSAPPGPSFASMLRR